MSQAQILHAIKENDLESLKQYIVDPFFHKNIELGTTPLQYAVYYKRLECIQLMISYKIDINIPDFRGMTALHYLVLNYDDNEGEQILLFLLENGINVNLCDKYGCTAFHYACWSNKINILKKLLNYNADINLTTKNGSTIYNSTKEQTRLLINNYSVFLKKKMEIYRLWELDS